MVILEPLLEIVIVYIGLLFLTAFIIGLLMIFKKI